MELAHFWGRKALEVNAKNICSSQATIFCRLKVIRERVLLSSSLYYETSPSTVS